MKKRMLTYFIQFIIILILCFQLFLATYLWHQYILISGSLIFQLKLPKIVMDSKLILTTEQNGQGFYVAQFKTSELAIFSYYIESQKEAVLIDPVFDVKTYTDFIAKRHTVLKYVFLTHYHADYLSGHTQFKVPICMGPDSKRAVNKFKVKECSDGEVLHLGNVKIRVVHSPGHTLESSCYILNDSTQKDVAFFAGDTVFLGEVGRPDLACSDKITSTDLAGMLYDSIQKVKKLEGTMRLYPGHGSGSACGKSIGAGNYCTVGAQFTNNYGFKFTNKQEFIKEVTANMPKPPKYFFFDAGLNQSGASHYHDVYNHAHVPLNEQEFTKLKSLVKVVDTRLDVGAGILRGSYWLPSSGPIVNFISNFIDHEQEFMLVVDQGKEHDIIDRFFRIGYFKIRGYNHFKINTLKEDFVKPVILKFDSLKQEKTVVHLDVRSKPQYTANGVVQGALLIPMPELQSRVGELKDKKGLVINCLSGMRSKVAFSVLAKHGIQSKILAQQFKEFKNRGYNVIEFKG